MPNAKLAEWFADADMNDTATVGGKGASLGEMFQKLSGIGVKVPNGFTLTTAAFKQFIKRKFQKQHGIILVLQRILRIYVMQQLTAPHWLMP